MLGGVGMGERISPFGWDDKGLSKGMVSGVARGKRIPPVGRNDKAFEQGHGIGCRTRRADSSL
jgi:hypothetical protein